VYRTSAAAEQWPNRVIPVHPRAIARVARVARVARAGPRSAFELEADLGPEQAGDLARVGVAPERGLGEDQLAIDGDLEASLARRDQLDRLDDGRPSVGQLSRQTDGSFVVASGDAVLDADAVPRVEHGLSG
jgi:hypothetical protein